MQVSVLWARSHTRICKKTLTMASRTLDQKMDFGSLESMKKVCKGFVDVVTYISDEIFYFRERNMIPKSSTARQIQEWHCSVSFTVVFLSVADSKKNPHLSFYSRNII
ncbi:unnamed protein product [Lactuca virosa]|uniref:Uncharacterized protein n=1 Tax=Lactuca virosa TaxID=75947 RepID=A0AAU9PS47_9ASTR|nr:unnamed protein product [Lactuca virosa]